MQTQFTVAKAAEILQLSRERIYQLEEQGKLQVTRGELNRRQNQKLVSYDALMRYIDALEHRAKRARTRLHRAANGEWD